MSCHLNLSSLIALTAQFQTYYRSLHDEAVGVHITNANPQQTGVLRLPLTQSRKLGRGNARTDSLGHDFNRLGFELIARSDLRPKDGAAPEITR